MLRAAYELFCERGFAGTTMELIAQRAGVAVQTLYFTFHTKSAVLEEAMGAAIMGFTRWDPRITLAVEVNARQAFRQQAWFEAFERAATAQEALGVFLESSLEIFRRVAPLALVQAAAAVSDPDVRAAVELGERRRVEGFTLVVELLAKRARLRRGMSVRRASDILLTLLSAETYHHFTQRRGWSPSDYGKWLTETLRSQFFA
jgi:AcrR family transcriptional regulator